MPPGPDCALVRRRCHTNSKPCGRRPKGAQCAFSIMRSSRAQAAAALSRSWWYSPTTRLRLAAVPATRISTLLRGAARGIGGWRASPSRIGSNWTSWRCPRVRPRRLLRGARPPGAAGSPPTASAAAAVHAGASDLRDGRETVARHPAPWVWTPWQLYAHLTAPRWAFAPGQGRACLEGRRQRDRAGQP